MRRAKISLELSEILGFDVDLITDGTLLSFAERTADNDKILICERASQGWKPLGAHSSSHRQSLEYTKDVKCEDFKKDSILYLAIVKNKSRNISLR